MSKRQMSKTEKNIARSTATVAIIVLLGKLIGFAREALIAAYYGATPETDAFFFANSMPAMLFPAVCSGISTAFLSLYVKRMEERGIAEGDRYASVMLGLTSLLGLALGLIGVLFSPVLVPLLAPGFSGAQLALAVSLSRIMLGSFILLMLQYMLTAILNAKRFFVGCQICALLYSLSVVLITVFLGPGQDMYALSWTVVLALLIQAAGLAVCCVRRVQWKWGLSGIRAEVGILLHLAIPILLGNSVLQINTIVDKALGSLLPDGSLSALNYGNTLSALVTSVFVTSLSTVLYPTLTSDAARGDLTRYSKTLTQSIEGLSLLLVPISIVSTLSAQDIVTFIYARGVFDQQAVAYTSTVLAVYAPMFVASGIREVLTRGFFAMQDTKTPMWNSAVGIGCNIVLSLLLVRPLGIAGIALGTTVSAYVTAVLLLNNARRMLPELSLCPCLKKLLLQGIAGAVSAAFLYGTASFIGTISNAFVRFAASAAIGFAVYAITLLLLRYPLPDSLQRMIKRGAG